MGHFFFYLSVVAASLLWSAACIAAAARSLRPWLRRMLITAAVVLPPLVLLPWVGLTATMAFRMNLATNWLAPTLTAFLSAVVGGVWILRVGMSRDAAGRVVAIGWPVIGLFAMFVMAKAVACGTLLFIDNAVAAESHALRVEAAQIMAASLPPQPAFDLDAAPIYRQAFAELGADRQLSAPGSPLTTSTTVDVTSPEVTELLARHAATLDLLRRAADRPGCRFLRDWSRPSISMLLPETGGMRQGARLLAVAARREAADGEAAKALADIVRLHRIGVHFATDPILICGLVGQALDSMAIETLIAVLPTLKPQDLPLLDEPSFQDFLRTSASYRRHFLGEEAFGLATMADVADGRLGGLTFLFTMNDAAQEQPLLVGPLSLLYRCFLLPSDMADYRKLMQRYQQMFAESASERPFPEIAKQVAEIEHDLKTRRAGLFSSLLAPALANVIRSEVKSSVLHRAARVLVAVTAARLASGTLPESVDALVPRPLPRLPQDPFTTDQPLLSRRADGFWTVWSVGPDGQDDGGPPPIRDAIAPDNDDIGLRLAL